MPPPRNPDVVFPRLKNLEHHPVPGRLKGQHEAAISYHQGRLQDKRTPVADPGFEKSRQVIAHEIIGEQYLRRTRWSQKWIEPFQSPILPYQIQSSDKGPEVSSFQPPAGEPTFHTRETPGTLPACRMPDHSSGTSSLRSRRPRCASGQNKQEAPVGKRANLSGPQVSSQSLKQIQ